MKTFQRLFILLALPLSFYACDDTDTDVMRPQVSLMSPGEDASFAAGTSIPFSANFTDDQGMASYNIEIHDNFDGHEHKSTMALQRWSWEQSFDITGTTAAAELTSEIAIPEDVAAGPYHFIVSAIDANGNATTYQDGSTLEVELHITNNSQALIELEMGDDHDGDDHDDDHGHDHDHDHGITLELDAEPGEQLHLHGYVSDQTTAQAGIEEIVITLGEDHDHDHEHKSATEEDEIEILFEFETPVLSFDFEENEAMLSGLVVPEDAVEDDHLLLKIAVKDIEGNMTVKKVEIHVHQD